MFISFEGIDFSGKSTQCLHVEKQLRDLGRNVLVVREPGGTEISEDIRSLLLDRRHRQMDPVTEMLLFSAARSQLVKEKIEPALQRGMIVLADRFHDSTTAYQGFGRGLDPDAVAVVHRFATHGTVPDLTFFLDLDYSESQNRRTTAGRDGDRMEESGRDFFESVRAGYLAIARDEPQRVHRIDATQREDLITGMLIAMINGHPRFGSLNQ